MSSWLSFYSTLLQNINRTSPYYHLCCSCNELLATCIDILAFVLLLAARRIYFNIEEFLTFSVRRNNHEFVHEADVFVIRFECPLSSPSHRRGEQGPWEADPVLPPPSIETDAVFKTIGNSEISDLTTPVHSRQLGTRGGKSELLTWNWEF